MAPQNPIFPATSLASFGRFPIWTICSETLLITFTLCLDFSPRVRCLSCGAGPELSSPGTGQRGQHPREPQDRPLLASVNKPTQNSRYIAQQTRSLAGRLDPGAWSSGSPKAVLRGAWASLGWLRRGGSCPCPCCNPSPARFACGVLRGSQLVPTQALTGVLSQQQLSRSRGALPVPHPGWGRVPSSALRPSLPACPGSSWAKEQLPAAHAYVTLRHSAGRSCFDTSVVSLSFPHTLLWLGVICQHEVFLINIIKLFYWSINTRQFY